MEVEVMGGELQPELGFPYWIPIRRRLHPQSPFFAAGNLERQLLAKQVALDWTEEEKQQVRNIEDQESRAANNGILPHSSTHSSPTLCTSLLLDTSFLCWKIKIYCPLVGCGAQLRSLYEFEDHYTSRHAAYCSVCSRVYPTSRLLSIHVSEVHDSFFKAKVARGFPMYECLVEGCGLKLKSYKSRQQHLVDKHKFPASFEFFKKAHPSKKQRRKDQHKKALRQAEAAPSAMQIEEDTMDELVSSVSKLSTSDSPSSISFGRRHTRGLAFIPRAVQQERKPGPSARMKS